MQLTYQPTTVLGPKLELVVFFCQLGFFLWLLGLEIWKLLT